MRLLVMFDLPVTHAEARREYTLFRRFLIQDGYDMIQYSIYGRITRNHDDASKHIAKVKQNLPTHGSVRILLVTEKQYASMQILVGKRTASEVLLVPREIIEL